MTWLDWKQTGLPVTASSAAVLRRNPQVQPAAG
jgi:hypothetical protein